MMTMLLRQKNAGLIRASEAGDIKAIQLLLEAGAKTNAKDKDDQTALDYACEYGYTEIVRLLIDAGAKVNGISRYTDPPLHTACAFGHPLIARMLIDHGANVNARDPRGLTSLHRACRSGRYEVVQLLLEKGAKADVKDKDDWTACSLAMELPEDNPVREQILDLFRQHAPEAVMEAYCIPDPDEHKYIDYCDVEEAIHHDK